MHTWARGRFLAHLPNQMRVLNKERQQENGFAELEDFGDDDAAQDESSDSEEGSDGEPMVSDAESGDAAPIPALQIGRQWYDSWRWGWAEETWKPFLAAVCPPLSVLRAMSMVSQDS